MLRKNPASSGRADRNVDSSHNDNEKGSKMKRQKESQTKAIVFCLGMLALLGLIAKVEVNHLHLYTSHLHQFTPKRLRNRDRNHDRNYEHNREGMKERRMKMKGDSPGGLDFIPPHSIYKLEVEDIYGKLINFSKFQGMVTLVVNVACSWGKTQVSYTELAELQKMYGSKGFSVLAFPISDFHQELGSNEEILSYVQENFPQVDFPLFGLSSLDESPVYQTIRNQKPGDSVKWNFYKFLVNRRGRVVDVFDKDVNPLEIADRIEILLNRWDKEGRHRPMVS